MIPVNIPWRLIAFGVVAMALISAGIWFRGVLADNKEMKLTVEAQAAEIKEVHGEVERMNKQDALDQALFANVEAQNQLHAADIQKQAAALRKLRKELDHAAQNCFSLTLPDVYLDGLPQAGN